MQISPPGFHDRLFVKGLEVMENYDVYERNGGNWTTLVWWWMRRKKKKKEKEKKKKKKKNVKISDLNCS